MRHRAVHSAPGSQCERILKVLKGLKMLKVLKVLQVLKIAVPRFVLGDRFFGAN